MCGGGLKLWAALPRVHGALLHSRRHSLRPRMYRRLLQMRIQRLRAVARLALLALPQPVDLAQRSQHAAPVVHAVPVQSIQNARGAGAGRNSVGRGEGVGGCRHGGRQAGVAGPGLSVETGKPAWMPGKRGPRDWCENRQSDGLIRELQRVSLLRARGCARNGGRGARTCGPALLLRSRSVRSSIWVRDGARATNARRLQCGRDGALSGRKRAWQQGRLLTCP